MALLHVPFGKSVTSGLWPKNPLYYHYNLPTFHPQPRLRRGVMLEKRMRRSGTVKCVEFNGTRKRPRLSVFCSNKQLYAMLVDDQNKKTIFYASTLQKYLQEDGSITTTEAARMVGEELIKAYQDLNISEISVRNRFARGERMVFLLR